MAGGRTSEGEGLPLGNGSKVDVAVSLTLRLVREDHKILLFFTHLELMTCV